MFNILMLLLPALACVARDPTEGKEKVHSFYVKYNHAKSREKRQIYPESFLPDPVSPGEVSAIPVEELPAADAVLPDPLDQMFPIVESFPVAERIQEEKTEQVADIDVLPESDPVMSDRMRGRERLLRADDATVADIQKTDLDPERVMEGRITDNVDIESVKAMDHWEPDSYQLEADRVVAEDNLSEVNLMGDNLGEGELEAVAVKEEPKLRWGPAIEEEPTEERLGEAIAIKSTDVKSDTEISGSDKEEEEEKEAGEGVEDVEKVEEEEQVMEEKKGNEEKEQLDDIKKSLEKVDKKLFLIGSLLDKKFNEVLAKLSNETSSTEKTTINVNRQINPTLIELAKLKNSSGIEKESTIEVSRKIDPTPVESAKTQNDSRVIEKESSIKVNRKIDPTPVQLKNESGIKNETIKLNPKLDPTTQVEVEKSAESDKSKSLTDNKEN